MAGPFSLGALFCLSDCAKAQDPSGKNLVLCPRMVVEKAAFPALRVCGPGAPLRIFRAFRGGDPLLGVAVSRLFAAFPVCSVSFRREAVREFRDESRVSAGSQCVFLGVQEAGLSLPQVRTPAFGRRSGRAFRLGVPQRAREGGFRETAFQAAEGNGKTGTRHGKGNLRL